MDKIILSPFVIRRRIRFGDCDPAGVIYTPRLSYLIVEAVLDFIATRLGGPAERRIMEMGILPPARSLSIEFLLPLRWDDEIDISVEVAEMRSSAIVFSITGCNGDRATAFSAVLTQVCVSSDTRKPTPIPDALRNALTANVSGKRPDQST